MLKPPSTLPYNFSTEDVRWAQGLINYIVSKPKCRHLKQFTCEGTLQQVFIRVYILEIQSVMLVFSTQLCGLLPVQPSLWFTSPIPVSKYSMWLGRGWGVLRPVGDHILQEFNILYLTRFRTYKIADFPKQKPRRGVSSEHLPQNPFIGQW